MPVIVAQLCSRCQPACVGLHPPMQQHDLSSLVRSGGGSGRRFGAGEEQVEAVGQVRREQRIPATHLPLKFTRFWLADFGAKSGFLLGTYSASRRLGHRAYLLLVW